MEPSPEPSCLTTPDAIVIDGANGVCDLRQRAGEPLGASLLPSLVLTVLAFVLLRRGARSMALAALILAALPGAYAAAFVRADRPTEVHATAAEVRALHDAVRAFGVAHGCARVTHDGCVACEPIVRLAGIDQRCDAPAAIDLYEDALEVGCVDRASRLVCGTAP